MAEMSDSSQPLFLRCAAAEALSRLSYPAGFDAAAQELYTQLGLLAFDCCNREITRVETWQAAYRPLDEFSTNGPAASTAGYSEQEYQAGAARQAVALRLKIKEQLTYIKNALEATVALGQESDEIDLHDGILSAVSDALTAVDQREEDGIFELDDLLEGVTDSANDLYDLLGIGDSPAPADTEEALGESGDEATGEDSGEVLPFDPTEAGGGPTAESGDAEPAEEEPPVEEEVIEEEVFDPTGLE